MKDCRHDPPKSTCRLCFLAGRLTTWPPPDRPAEPERSVRCAHLGLEVVGLRDCPSCKGRVRKKEFVCAAGLGVDGRAVPSVDCGPKCSGYEATG